MKRLRKLWRWLKYGDADLMSWNEYLRSDPDE